MALESLAGPMEEQENPLDREHSLSVILPGGVVKAVTVHGSTPVMDLLVTLCAKYHLNPTDHTVEVLSPNRNNIAFKPNCPIGLLEAETILLKPKVVEEKIRRPYVPEATVRLLINYKKSHKAVVRVNPKVPLAQLMPVVCEKCEFEVETTVLLRDAHGEVPLDPAMSLNDCGLREVYAKDTAAVTPTRAELPTTPPPPEEDTKARRTEKKHKGTTQKENKGFFGLFKRSKKKLETDVSVSAPASPTLSSSRGAVVTGPWSHGTMPADAGTKKRRAPPPPPSAGMSQSVPENLSTRHLTSPDGLMKSAQSRVSSAESSLKRTKRKAPPPPPAPACADTHLESPQDAEVTGPLNRLYTLEELGEHDELSSPSPYPSPPPSSSSSSSSSSPLRMARVRPRGAHVATPSPLLGRGEDPPSPSGAVARIMNRALAAGVQLKPVQLKPVQSSSAFPGLRRGSSPSPDQERRPGVVPARVSSFSLHPTPAGDPALRKGTTTFTVVPRLRLTSFEVEPTPGVPERAERDEGGRPAAAGAADEAGDRRVESPGSLQRAEVERPALESGPTSGVLLSARSTPPCTGTEAQATLPLPERDQTSLPPGPDHLSSSPEAKPDHLSMSLEAKPDHPSPSPAAKSDHLSMSPEAKPDRLSPSPEAKPDHPSPSPEAKPDYPSMSPEAKPDRLSPSPEAKPDHPSPSPEAKPDYPSMSPEAKPDHPSPSLEAKPDHPSPSPEAKPDYPSKSPEAKPDPPSPSPEAKPDYPSKPPEAKPDHRSPPLDLDHTSPPPKVTEEEEGLAERAEVTGIKEAACASPQCSPEKPCVPRSPSVPNPPPPARDYVSTAEREGSSPHPDVEGPIAAPVQREREEVKGEKEMKGEEEEDNAFPPPPPPVFFHEETAEEGDGASPPPDHPTHLTSPKPCRPPSTALARVGAAPSRFAQAVAQAVQRSQLPGRGRAASGGSPGSASSQNGTASVKTSC